MSENNKQELYESSDTIKLRQDISNNHVLSSKNKEKILYLLDKFQEQWLSSREEFLIKKEIEYHTELEWLEWWYNKNKKSLWSESIQDLDKLITNLEQKDYLVSAQDLNKLSNNIWKSISLNNRSEIFWISMWNSYRDFVKKHIDFWWIPEDIFETDFIKDFNNIFTILYRKHIEKRDKKNDTNFSDFDWLDLSKLELFKIIADTKAELKNLNKKQYDESSTTITFTLNSWEKVIQDIRSLNIETDLKNSDEKQEIKKKEINKIEPKKIETNKSDNKNQPTQKHLDKKVTKIWEVEKVKKVSLRDLVKAEKSSDFVLSEYFDNKWVPQVITDIFNVLVKTDLWNNQLLLDSKNKNKILVNLKNSLNFVLRIESYWWKNEPNKNGSWAKWYYQLHTWNSWEWFMKVVDEKFVEIKQDEYEKLQNDPTNKLSVDKFYKTNSYETSIRSTISFFKKLWEKWEIWKNISFFVEGDNVRLIIKSWKNKLREYILSNWNQKIAPKFEEIVWWKRFKLDVLNLWVIEQTLLFLVDIFERWLKKDENTREIITNMFLWDKDKLASFYNYFHNTDAKQYKWSAKDLIDEVLNSTQLLEIS